MIKIHTGHWHGMHFWALDSCTKDLQKLGRLGIDNKSMCHVAWELGLLRTTQRSFAYIGLATDRVCTLCMLLCFIPVTLRHDSPSKIPFPRLQVPSRYRVRKDTTTTPRLLPSYHQMRPDCSSKIPLPKRLFSLQAPSHYLMRTGATINGRLPHYHKGIEQVALLYWYTTCACTESSEPVRERKPFITVSTKYLLVSATNAGVTELVRLVRFRLDHFSPRVNYIHEV